MTENKDLDVTNVARGVWLVKVPKYISNRWNKLRDTEVGRLRISKSSSAKLDVVFTLSDNVVKCSDPGDTVVIPKEHQFVVSKISAQSLAVFSQSTERIIMEGRVTQKAECRPVANDMKYMQLKKHTISQQTQPMRTTKQIGHVVNVYKPVSDHKNNIEFELQKKSEGKKSRDDRDKVMDMLFAAFEKHQYYNIKDLVRITRQPIAELIQPFGKFRWGEIDFGWDVCHITNGNHIEPNRLRNEKTDVLCFKMTPAPILGPSTAAGSEYFFDF